jgi:hypothetical protein
MKNKKTGYNLFYKKIIKYENQDTEIGQPIRMQKTGWYTLKLLHLLYY